MRREKWNSCARHASEEHHRALAISVDGAARTHREHPGLPTLETLSGSWFCVDKLNRAVVDLKFLILEKSEHLGTGEQRRTVAVSSKGARRTMVVKRRVECHSGPDARP